MCERRGEETVVLRQSVYVHNLVLEAPNLKLADSVLEFGIPIDKDAASHRHHHHYPTFYERGKLTSIFDSLGRWWRQMDTRNRYGDGWRLPLRPMNRWGTSSRLRMPILTPATRTLALFLWPQGLVSQLLDPRPSHGYRNPQSNFSLADGDFRLWNNGSFTSHISESESGGRSCGRISEDGSLKVLISLPAPDCVGGKFPVPTCGITGIWNVL
ncbi:hypothetical protein BJ912DRAFT_1047130 [Pholiota molesta]|nr:hypothetical protein BJ912DRAFT_1047130 [Pholiota molesta]